MAGDEVERPVAGDADLEPVFEVRSQTQPDGLPAILDTVPQLGYFLELT